MFIKKTVIRGVFILLKYVDVIESFSEADEGYI